MKQSLARGCRLLRHPQMLLAMTKSAQKFFSKKRGATTMKNFYLKKKKVYDTIVVGFGGRSLTWGRQCYR
jgi:hypothetical protein